MNSQKHAAPGGVPEESFLVSAVSYFVLCFLGSAANTSCAIILWSDMHYGKDCLRWLQEYSEFADYCFIAVGVTLALLYLLDFFFPPHYNEHFVLWQGDRAVGSAIIGLVLLVTLAGCLLKCNVHAWTPVLLTCFSPPWVISAIRAAVRPKQSFPMAGEMTDSTVDKWQMLELVLSEEAERTSFYRGAQVALLATAGITVGSWAYWIDNEEQHFHDVKQATDPHQRQENFVRWVTPLLLALSLLAFAWLISVRIKLASTYSKTNKVRQRLMVQAVSEVLGRPPQVNAVQTRRERLHEKALFELRQELIQLGIESLQMDRLSSQGFEDEYAELQYSRSIQYLLRKLKIVVGLIASVQAGAFLLYQVGAGEENKSILLMIQAWLMLVFVHACGFVYLSFNRLVLAVIAYLEANPLTKVALDSLMDWARAGLVYYLVPFAPVVLLTSALNQCIRRVRGIKSNSGNGLARMRGFARRVIFSKRSGLPVDAVRRAQPEERAVVEQEEQELLEAGTCLTLRVHKFLKNTSRWDWPSIITKIYIIGFGMISSALAPLLLNVLLAWMSEKLRDLDFACIAASVYLIGLVMFLLPPVPGAPVYLFGGVLLSDKGHRDWDPSGGHTGFWLSTALCVLVCWFMKLSSAVIQQKCMGEMLGSRLRIRRLVGVHKPFIRAIELVLRKRGLSFGKVMILCGGPDWPTAVLCGVLRLSLAQCIVGTAPVVLYVAPFCLSGSFYIMKEEGDYWSNLGELMFTITAVMTIAMWAVIVLIIQSTMAKEERALSRPKEEYVELEWMDFRETEIAKRCTITWQDIPCCIRLLLRVGCLGTVVAGNLFYWMSGRCLGKFQVTTPISTLSWYGKEDSIISREGLLGLCVASGSFGCWLVFALWSSCKSAGPRARAMKVVDAMADEWKRRRYEEARRAAEEEQEEEQRDALAPAKPEPGSQHERRLTLDVEMVPPPEGGQRASQRRSLLEAQDSEVAAGASRPA